MISLAFYSGNNFRIVLVENGYKVAEAVSETDINADWETLQIELEKKTKLLEQIKQGNETIIQFSFPDTQPVNDGDFQKRLSSSLVWSLLANVTAPQQYSPTNHVVIDDNITPTEFPTEPTTIEPQESEPESNEDALLEAIQLSHLRHKMLTQIIPFHNMQMSAFEQFTNHYLKSLHETLSSISVPSPILNQIIQYEHSRFRDLKDTIFDSKLTINALDDEIQKKKRSAEVIRYIVLSLIFHRLKSE